MSANGSHGPAPVPEVMPAGTKAQLVEGIKVGFVETQQGRLVVLETVTETGNNRYALWADPAKEIAKGITAAASGIVLS